MNPEACSGYEDCLMVISNAIKAAVTAAVRKLDKEAYLLHVDTSHRRLWDTALMPGASFGLLRTRTKLCLRHEY